MPNEDTDLERRVVAHEEILQALMAQLAESQPGFLDRLHDRFAGARRVSHEHDVETADYAEAFLHEVMRLVRVDEARHAVLAAAAPADAPRARKPRKLWDANRPVVIRTRPTGRVWHVTRDEVFFGDYLAENVARDAAAKAARHIEDLGGRAQVIFEAAR